jgi:hypothetical protein
MAFNFGGGTSNTNSSESAPAFSFGGPSGSSAAPAFGSSAGKSVTMTIIYYNIIVILSSSLVL